MDSPPESFSLRENKSQWPGFRPWLTLAMYAAGLAYHFTLARLRLVSAAPEELAARSGHED